jgi:hypothetical protein
MGERENQIRTWLFNPFIYIAGFKSLLIGIALMAISAWVGFLNNSHFDGVLDMHRAMAAQFHIFLPEVVIDWVSISLVLFVFGVILSKSKIRWIDVFGTQALARWPMIPVAILVVFIPNVRNMNLSNPQDMILLLIPAMLLLPFMIWFVALMFNAYKVSCNLKGNSLIISFIGGLISAELISKILITQLVFGMMILPSNSQASTIPLQGKESSIEIANDILSSLKEQNYAQASIAFDDNMKAQVTLLKLQQVWSSMISQSGDFQKIVDNKVSETNGNDVVLIICQFERAKMNMTTSINNKKEVVGLYFKPYQAPTKTIEVKEEELQKYLGIYSGPSFPLKVTITNSGNKLIGQATSQPSFQLECFEGHKFKFDQAGLKLEFVPNENKMILLQGVGRFELKKE